MHAHRRARDAYFPHPADDVFFGARGDIVLRDARLAREFANRIHEDGRSPDERLRPAELAAMSLVHEIGHAVIAAFRAERPGGFGLLRARLESTLPGGATPTLTHFLSDFPPPAVYAGLRGETDETAERFLARGGNEAYEGYIDEILLFYVTSCNPAYDPIRSIVGDATLRDEYVRFVEVTKASFGAEADQGHVNGRENLLDLLLTPIRQAPHSIFAQLDFMLGHWVSRFGLERQGFDRQRLWLSDFVREEGAWFVRGGPGPGPATLESLRFSHTDDDGKHFSHDSAWMPNVVLMAKTAFVWLDQLSRTYGRPIERLDHIPDEELDLLASRGFTGLWLIGVFERSEASRKIKQRNGDANAVASAYALRNYTIAEALGGQAAYENLRTRASARGVRLAADMVPNHVGVDADWVIRHPDWFVQSQKPPFPSYRFEGPDLSGDPRVGVFLEEGYWDRSDAAVVFRRHDRWTGTDTFIYHGNDGTSMPWNDTAQLDYTKQEVRRALIETIVHVARLFPIVRFDAAMTLAKRHYQRLWFPLPGSGGAIASRADYALSQEEFDRAMPAEFWREVVDEVAVRAPDTLLLAEAFWMMEGYFVRTLGMHRVYNSAFMNMLKAEDNAAYRQTVKNVLEFDPEILKRFVNFMNNPDEEPAVVQFGSDDKYFGVCTLMCTMPGLPMFGHGQIEGFHEKYGMEYRTARWDETPSRALLERHEREIFPLLRRRHWWSGVEHFVLYDFVGDSGIDENVFAFSNGSGDRRVLVFYNNRWTETSGRVDHGSAKKSENGDLRGPPSRVIEELGCEALDSEQNRWIIFRDVIRDLEFLRPASDVQQGIFLKLVGYETRVLSDFRIVADAPGLSELHRELGEGGVASVERAARMLRMRPTQDLLRACLAKENMETLRGAWDPVIHAPHAEGAAMLLRGLRGVAEGFASLGANTTNIEHSFTLAVQRYEALLRAEHADARPSNRYQVCADRSDPSLPFALLLAWLQLDAIVSMLQRPGEAKADAAGAWFLEEELLRDGGAGPWATDEGVGLILLAATTPSLPLRHAMITVFGESLGRRFLGVHDAQGITWLNQERFEALAQLLAYRDFVDGRASCALAERQTQDLCRLARRHSYQVAPITEALAGAILSSPTS